MTIKSKSVVPVPLAFEEPGPGRRLVLPYRLHLGGDGVPSLPQGWIDRIKRFDATSFVLKARLPKKGQNKTTPAPPPADPGGIVRHFHPAMGGAGKRQCGGQQRGIYDETSTQRP